MADRMPVTNYPNSPLCPPLNIDSLQAKEIKKKKKIYNSDHVIELKKIAGSRYKKS